MQIGKAENAQHISLESDIMMKQFESKMDPDCLLKAIAATDRQKTSEAEEAISIRVALLKRLTTYYDPTYDLNPPPPVRSHVMPPMGYNTGVPPELVTDLNLREDYARRIEENRINSQRHKIQTAIRQLMSKVVYLSLNAERGDLESVEIRLQGLEMQQEMAHAMQALAQESKKKPATEDSSSYIQGQ